MVQIELAGSEPLDFLCMVKTAFWAGRCVAVIREQCVVSAVYAADANGVFKQLSGGVDVRVSGVDVVDATGEYGRSAHYVDSVVAAGFETLQPDAAIGIMRDARLWRASFARGCIENKDDYKTVCAKASAHCPMGSIQPARPGTPLDFRSSFLGCYPNTFVDSALNALW